MTNEPTKYILPASGLFIGTDKGLIEIKHMACTAINRCGKCDICTPKSVR